MKTRNGFVSNSSSSSFVVIGFDFPRDSDVMDRKKFVDQVLKMDVSNMDEYQIDDAIWDAKRSGNWVLLDHEEYGAPKGRTILGLMIAKTGCEEYSLDQDEVPVEAYMMDIKKAQEYLGIEGDIKIYTGSMLS